MSRAKFEAARELIQQRNYDAARAILETMPGEPRAIEWLAKLDRIGPAAKNVVLARPRGMSVGQFVAVTFAVVVLAAIGIGLFLVFRSNMGTVAANLPEMYSKHGLIVRYPTGWKIAEQPLGLSMAPDESKPSQLILIYTNRTLKSDDPVVSVEKECKNEKLKSEGLIENDGHILVKPDGQFLSVEQVSVGGYIGVRCGYKSENTIVKGTYLRLGPSVSITVFGYSNNAQTFEPLLDQITNTFKIDTSQLGTWLSSIPTVDLAKIKAGATATQNALLTAAAPGHAAK